jgi:DNA-binding LytR/AlgR family response regulator
MMEHFHLKILLLDDEPRALDLLRGYAEQLPFLQVVAALRDPLQAVDFLQRESVDVLFLDINMPRLSGLELFKSLSNPPLAIFTTAYPEYAVQAFEVQALDYLVKPIAFPRFMQACLRAASACKIAMSAPSQDLSSPESRAMNIVFVKSGTTLHKLHWEEVLYLEKDENYVLYQTKHKKILCRQTLSDAAELAPDWFVRIHKSYVVSLRHIRKAERDQITLENDVFLPIGEAFRADLMEKINGST